MYSKIDNVNDLNVIVKRIDEVANMLRISAQLYDLDSEDTNVNIALVESYTEELRRLYKRFKELN